VPLSRLWVASAAMLMPLLISSGGCLSFGGGETTHYHDTPETKKRLSALESRVNALERYFDGDPIQSAAPLAIP
jgi:hypothetical protein